MRSYRRDYLGINWVQTVDGINNFLSEKNKFIRYITRETRLINYC